MMLLVVLSILVSMYTVHSEDLYGDLDAIEPHDRKYIRNLIALPKPLDLNIKIQGCSRHLSIALLYLCPPNRKSHPRQISSIEQKTPLLTEECCDQMCTLRTLLDYCP
ncbi:unnamed protein product [Euphydryas editha]|uniref:Insulin-like domain-containing protein n=1 Tax=Euphydryas editha TaxID=104508 RepID=A0AAU9VCH5_EUPED|nr:unnamed protein product [Euphydryas editha]